MNGVIHNTGRAFRVICVVGLVLVSVSCTRDVLFDGGAARKGDICFRTEINGFSGNGEVSMKSIGMTELTGGPCTLYLHAIESEWEVDGTETKASPYTAVPTTMRLSGYSFTGAWSDSNLPNLFSDVTLTKSGSYWTGLSPRISWPGASYNVRFAGISPAMPYGFTWVNTSFTAGLPRINFSIRDDVALQVDLLECVSSDYIGDGSTAGSGVTLPFKHALTAIKFKTNNFGVAGTIKSVSIEGVYNTGSHLLGASTWNSFSGSATYSVTVNQAFTATGETSILSGANTLLLLPQTCPSTAKLTVVVTVGGTDYKLISSLSGQVWAPGKEITYTICPASSDYKSAVIEISSVPESVKSGVSTVVAVVKSYSEHLLGFEQAVPWSVEYSTDGGSSYSTTKPSWLTSISPISGSGGRDGETITATATRASNAEHRVKVKVSNSGDSNTFDIVIPEVGPFGGLWIAPAPLYYNGTTFEIKDDDWNHDSYNDKYGKVAGSYYFNFIELGQYFDADGNSFSTSSGDIDNTNKISYGGHDDWRMPTRVELGTFVGLSVGKSRVGATVNGNSGSKYALIQLTGATHAGNSTVAGLLLFPDNATIVGKTLSGINDYNSLTTDVTISELNVYLDAGCAFIPSSGAYPGWWSLSGYGTYWWSTTNRNNNTGYTLSFSSAGQLGVDTETNKTSLYCPVRLVR